MRDPILKPEAGLISFPEPNRPNVTEADNSFVEEGIDLRHYWAVIYQYKWRILLLAFGVTLIVTLIVFSMKPVYRSTATLLVEGKQNTLLSIEEVYSMDTSRNEYFQTQFEILKSPDLARRVIRTLKLAENPEFSQEPVAPEEKTFWHGWLDNMPAISDQQQNTGIEQAKLKAEERLLGDFLSRLAVKPRIKTQLVDISFDAHDPSLARTVVDGLGEAFIESGMESRMESTRKGAEWLSSRLQSLKTKLAESENRLQDFLAKEHLVDLEGVQTLAGKEIEQNSERLTKARQALLEAESTYNKIKHGSDVALIPEVFQDASIQSLKEKETELARKVSDLNQHYGTDHPNMVAASSELKAVEELLKKQIRVITSGIKNRYELAKTNEQSIRASIEANKNQVQDIGRKQARFKELQREVEANRNLYETFFNRFKEANEAAEITAANARFVDHANQPFVPVKPQKMLVIVLTFLGMSLLGASLAFLLDHLDSTLKSPDDVERKLGSPLLGAVPLVPKLTVEDIGRIVVNDPQSTFAEAIRTIRTGLMLPTMDSSNRVWMVTSSFQNEGKSTIAMNLAQAIALMADDKGNRVLLVDADLRRPRLHKLFKLPHRAKGLSDVLVNDEKLDDCLYPIGGLMLDILPAGMPPQNPLELLASKAFANLLEELEQRYSVILIDSPPVHSVSDALWLAQHVRSLIYVVKSDSTSIKAVRKGLNLLDRSGAPLAGIVMAQLDVEKARHYGNGDYSNHYYYQTAYGPESGNI